jgi:sugar phosphate isomerase/epimerase
MRGQDSLGVNVKGCFPFRLGTTSYIVPADILTNVKLLAERVDDIELVLFDSDEISNIPDAELVRAFRDISAENGNTYTVHLPLDIQLGSSNEDERSKSVDKCLRVMDRLSPADPFAYIVHFHGDRRGNKPSNNVAQWQANLEKSIKRLLQSNVDSGDLCVETLDYSYEFIDKLVYDYDLSICLDVGHILLNAHSLEDYLDHYMKKIRVIHLHGISDGIDHKDISFLDSDCLLTLISRICENKAEARVVTLEVFSEKELVKSVSVLEKLIR